MRRTLILALMVLMLSAGLCAAGAASVSRAVDAADAALRQAEAAARDGDAEAAAEHLRALSEDWRSRGRVLELIAAHDALSDVTALADDARVCLENGDPAEFRRAAAALRASLTHLKEAEAIRLMNLF